MHERSAGPVAGDVPEEVLQPDAKPGREQGVGDQVRLRHPAGEALEGADEQGGGGRVDAVAEVLDGQPGGHAAGVELDEAPAVVPVLQEDVRDPAHEGHQVVGIGPRDDGREPGCEAVVELLEQLVEQRLLAREVDVEGAVGDPGGGGDVADRGRLEAVLLEQSAGHGAELTAGLCLAGLAVGGHGRSEG